MATILITPAKWSMYSGWMNMYLPYGVTEESQMTYIDQAVRGQF